MRGEAGRCIAQLGTAKGIECIVCADIAICSLHGGYQCVVFRIIGIYHTGLRCQANILIGTVQVQVNIGLAVTIHKVQIVAAVCFFQIHIRCCIDVLCCAQEVLLIGCGSGKVQSLAKIALLNIPFVCLTHNRIGHHFSRTASRLAGLRIAGLGFAGFRLFAQFYGVEVNRELGYIHLGGIIAGDVRGIGNRSIIMDLTLILIGA